jgi:hypothetical protein
MFKPGTVRDARTLAVVRSAKVLLGLTAFQVVNYLLDLALLGQYEGLAARLTFALGLLWYAWAIPSLEADER